MISIDQPSGKTALFFQGTSPIGFTNALKIDARRTGVSAAPFRPQAAPPEPGPLFGSSTAMVRKLAQLGRLGPCQRAMGHGAERSRRNRTIVDLEYF